MNKKIKKPPINTNLQVCTFARPLFGIISLFLRSAVMHYQGNIEQMSLENNPTSERNLINGFNTIDQFYKETKQSSKDALINLRDWESNMIIFFFFFLKPASTNFLSPLYPLDKKDEFPIDWNSKFRSNSKLEVEIKFCSSNGFNIKPF